MNDYSWLSTRYQLQFRNREHLVLSNHSPHHQFISSCEMLFSIPLFVIILSQLPSHFDATSLKMDFLSSGVVRTDPLEFSNTGNCLSDHVHRYYGSVSDRTMRPEVSYEDLRNTTGNTGNVEENKSLSVSYTHLTLPTIYSV